MAKLITPGGHRPLMRLNLYCWPCRTVHAFPLTDVERIVYAFGGAEADRDADPEPFTDGEPMPSCLVDVLGVSNLAEMYAEHVDRGVECRELDGQEG